MPKVKGSLELPLRGRADGHSLTDWLYEELRAAIVEGRLAGGTRLPATRDFAAMHGVSRGVVVEAFERLQSEGYLCSRVGAGTWVNDRVMPRARSIAAPATEPAYIRRTVAGYARPKAWVGLAAAPMRPFRMGVPEEREFPAKLWATLAARRAKAGTWILGEHDARGYRPLREAIARYLGSARGVVCEADQIVIVSGIQQALDVLARILVRPGGRVWMEDPGYFGARIAFENVRARIVPVPVDDEGICVARGVRKAAGAVGAYVTPAHQFPLGMTMSLGRRMELLRWAEESGAFVIEDDYDSEYRFAARPIPALMSLDRGSNVVLVGSFSKLMFRSLRIGYIVAPRKLTDYIAAFRMRTDFRAVHFEQAVLSEFIERGHLGRHVRRMREIYAARRGELLDAARRYLRGALEVAGAHCGLYTAAYLRNGMSSAQAEAAAGAAGVEALALDRYTVAARDPQGLLLGFASFREEEIREGVRRLARGLG